MKFLMGTTIQAQKMKGEPATKLEHSDICSIFESWLFLLGFCQQIRGDYQPIVSTVAKLYLVVM